MIRWEPAPEFMSDEELVAAYEQTSGEPGDDRAEAILAEIKRRKLDFQLAAPR